MINQDGELIECKVSEIDKLRGTLCAIVIACGIEVKSKDCPRCMEKFSRILDIAYEPVKEFMNSLELETTNED